MPNSEEKFLYGCVFCRTGQEKVVAELLERKYEGLKATAVYQIKHKSVQSRKTTEQVVVFPGYVFFYTEAENAVFPDIGHMSGVIRLLQGQEGQWTLSGQDFEFASWVFKQGGLIGLSKVYRENDKVKVLSGPLKDYEGNILKIDGRSRNALVEFRFDERIWKVWMAFEWLD